MPIKPLLTLNTIKMLLSVTEKSVTPVPNATVTLPLKPNVKLPLLKPKVFWLMLKPSSRPLLKTSLSSNKLLLMVLLLELNKLLTMLLVKLNTKKLLMPSVKPLELSVTYKLADLGSNLKVKLKKSPKKYNL